MLSKEVKKGLPENGIPKPQRTNSMDNVKRHETTVFRAEELHDYVMTLKCHKKRKVGVQKGLHIER